LRNCRKEEDNEEEEIKKFKVAFAEASSASLDYIDSSDASRYKGTREICEAIMDPIAVTALLYKLNIVKLQLCISFVAYLLYLVKGSFLNDTGNMVKTPKLHLYIFIYLYIL